MLYRAPIGPVFGPYKPYRAPIQTSTTQVHKQELSHWFSFSFIKSPDLSHSYRQIINCQLEDMAAMGPPRYGAGTTPVWCRGGNRFVKGGIQQSDQKGH